MLENPFFVFNPYMWEYTGVFWSVFESWQLLLTLYFLCMSNDSLDDVLNVSFGDSQKVTLTQDLNDTKVSRWWQ